jgi:Leucine-rich repeat (LRR) protein
MKKLFFLNCIIFLSLSIFPVRARLFIHYCNNWYGPKNKDCLTDRDLIEACSNELKGVEKLALSGCRLLTDVSALSSLTNLRWLYLNGCTGLTRLPNLIETCSYLDTIDIKNTGALEESIRIFVQPLFIVQDRPAIEELFKLLKANGSLYPS